MFMFNWFSDFMGYVTINKIKYKGPLNNWQESQSIYLTGDDALKFHLDEQRIEELAVLGVEQYNSLMQAMCREYFENFEQKESKVA